MIAPSAASAAMWSRLYAIGRATPCERRGRGEPVLVMAVDEARGERLVAALAPHFLVVRPSVPWEVLVHAPGSEAWLEGVLDALGLASLVAVVTTEPLSHVAARANDECGVAVDWLVVASARGASAVASARGASAVTSALAARDDAPPDDRIATLRGALASAGLATRVSRERPCCSSAAGRRSAQR